MEVVIRLQRASSAKKRYNFRIVASNKTRARQSRNLEILGHYDPSQQPATLSINQEKLDRWVKKGAVMSDTVRSLVKKSQKKS